MASNLELKARLRDPAAARDVARRLAGPPVAVLRQCDVFFHARFGRLKLRTINGEDSELIWYQRPDLAGSKRSDYLRTPVADAAALSELLAGALGAWATVRKTRVLHLDEGVRIHLDEVEDLGDFVEFEAVLSDDLDSEAARRRLNRLVAEFQLAPADFVPEAYADLLGSEA